MEIRERLAAVLKNKRWRGADLARELGEHRNWVNGRLSGKIAIKTEDVERIAKALDIPTSDLFMSPTQPARQRFPQFGSVVLVPLVNVSLSAGQTVYGETRESVPVPAELVPGRTLVAARVTGECMEPEVRPGDIAIVDVSDRMPHMGDLVAVLMEDGSMNVKRFGRDEAGPLLVDNKGGRYRPNGAKIQGVVVYVGRAYR